MSRRKRVTLFAMPGVVVRIVLRWVGDTAVTGPLCPCAPHTHYKGWGPLPSVVEGWSHERGRS